MVLESMDGKPHTQLPPSQDPIELPVFSSIFPFPFLLFPSPHKQWLEIECGIEEESGNTINHMPETVFPPFRSTLESQPYPLLARSRSRTSSSNCGNESMGGVGIESR